MTDVTLHATPRQRDVVLEQVRVVELALRPVTLVIAIVLGIVAIRVVLAIVQHNAGSWFDGDASAAVCFGSFFIPFAVWRGNRRFAPAFLWTLPVDRRRLVLTRTFAGWVWLMAALLVFLAWRVGLSTLAGSTIRPFSFAAATAAYLCGSAVVIGLRYPLRWVLGSAAVAYLVGLASQIREIDAMLKANGVFARIERADATWRIIPFPIFTLLLIAAGLAALWAAASRHRELRRH